MKKAINGSRIHLFGVAYKKDVSDMRESPALDVLELLHRRGAIAELHRSVRARRSQHGDLDLMSVPEKRGRAGIDCAVICTNHRRSTTRAIVERFPLVVDTRNALKSNNAGNVFRL